VIAKAGDLAAQLTNLEERDVLFIDEIHRLNPAVEEILYPAMEDYQLDLIIGEGRRRARQDRAAQVHPGRRHHAGGALTTPLRDRFGIPIRLEFYTVDELELIVKRGARVLGVGMSEDGANEIAKRSRARPASPAACCAGARLRGGGGRPTRSPGRSPDGAPAALTWTGRPRRMDRKVPHHDRRNFGGGPVGIETIAAALSEPRDAIEEIIEPYLIQNGLVQRTPRGRVLTGHAFRHLGLPEPSREATQFGLFGAGDDA
jgi:Holliday junction DNA helicase RuvB